MMPTDFTATGEAVTTGPSNFITTTFSFSDTIAGYVTHFDADRDSFGLRTSDGREFQVRLTPMTYAKLVRNLNEAYLDCTGQMRSMLVPGRLAFAYGIYYPEVGGAEFEVKELVFVSRGKQEYCFEKQDWWIKQLASIGDFWLKAQFGDEGVDYRNYRTQITIGGEKTTNYRQETDTISRLVYGFATAYLLTGDDRYLEAAEKGTDYLRDHMRFYDADEEIVYWYHGIDVSGQREQKVFASEFGDDYQAIPAYEQIYALAGPIQTYRITGDPRILNDAEMTVGLFNKFFLDKEGNGSYFSHIDPITLDPRSETLGSNRARKNWNSVGDHAPAYLINLFLATGEKEYADMLIDCADTIEKHFKDYDNSPFVQEKFFEDWTHDKTWGWQQNRGVVGHNLKIAWNLMRIHHLSPNEKYVDFAKKIAEIMPTVGYDRQRSGWYDVMERVTESGKKNHRFVWHDRKAWWQQEQAILAYLIMAGSLGSEDYLRLARESEAFYNAYHLDHDDGGIYFNVLANGLPYLLGTERFKGSHSMSGYHSTELCYLSAVYGNLLVYKNPMDFYFRPKPNGFKNNVLRTAPDILPPGSIRLEKVWVNGEVYHDFDAENLTVNLPDSKEDLRVKVTIVPVGQ